jgi:hypothetical protein
MRLYTFCNFYLSSIQQGIQPAHVVADMFVKYSGSTTQNHESYSLFEWAKNHKTMICLNGGNAADIREVWEKVQQLGRELGLAHGCFHEDEQSLDGTMTCVGIVVPTRIYEYNDQVRALTENVLAIFDDQRIVLDANEWTLADLISKYSLAK